jgi:bifunctional non-homologous end joining protein LigD
VEIAGVGLTHPDRILFPEQNLTKLGLAQYYEQIADWVLPHVVDRPLALVRCPKGRNNECFFQKHVNVSLPEVINSVMIEEKDGKHLYISISNLAGLIALVQVNALEIHPWGSRIDRLEKPDRLTFDLDPGPDVQWPAIVEAAFTLHDILSALELESFVKTSGGKGLHVVVPLARRASWEDIRSFAEGISRGMARQEQYLATSSKSKRKERIYIDYLRNLRGATTVAAYSTRARPGATVSASLRWEELGGNSNPQYTTETLPKRLASLKEDPWKGFFDINQTITKARLEAVQG